jgi:hypothetical protein
LSDRGVEKTSGQQNAGKSGDGKKTPEHERSFAKGKV